MNCDEWFEKLYQLLDRDMDDTLWQDVERHMKDCRPCFDRFEFEKLLKKRVKDSCCEESCTETLRVRIKAIFEKL